MKTANAVKKLKSAGYSVSESAGSFQASNGSVLISFFTQNGNTKNFTFDSDSSCAPTYGLTLKAAMA